MKKVCFFGIYKSEFARNRVLIEGFKRHGFGVVECKVDPTELGSIEKYFALYREYRAIRKQKFDHIIVAFPAHAVVWFAWLLFGNRIIFDAWDSLYDANVVDRRLYSGRSIRGIRDFLFDWIGVRVSQYTLLHSKGTKDLFLSRFGGSPDRYIVLYTGTDDMLFHPLPERVKEEGEPFYAHFHAAFTPVQGVEHIVEAAKILRGKGVEVHIVGYGGRLYREIEEKVTREELSDVVTLHGRVPFLDMPLWIAKADACIGIFGDTEKAKTTSVPTKIFEYIAMKKAVVTADTLPIREVFVDKENILLARIADPGDLASKLLLLKQDKELRERIAENSYTLFKRAFTPQAVVQTLLQHLHD